MRAHPIHHLHHIHRCPTSLELRVSAASALMGVWIFASAHLWPHGGASKANLEIVGTLCVLFAWASANFPRLRQLNALLALWLMVSTLALRQVNPGAAWNSVIVATVLFVVSRMRTRPERVAPWRLRLRRR